MPTIFYTVSAVGRRSALTLNLKNSRTLLARCRAVALRRSDVALPVKRHSRSACRACLRTERAPDAGAQLFRRSNDARPNRRQTAVQRVVPSRAEVPERPRESCLPLSADAKDLIQEIDVM